jgi:hypothetical protein
MASNTHFPQRVERQNNFNLKIFVVIISAFYFARTNAKMFQVESIIRLDRPGPFRALVVY